jgi:nicotinate dehydrogenase subunit A
VLLGGEPTRSCITPVGDIGDAKIVTLDGLATDGKPHPLQAAFIDVQAAQCGYCINGMIMTAKALLDKPSIPEDAMIKEALSGNLCRCGVHNRIVEAVRIAARELAR